MGGKKPQKGLKLRPIPGKSTENDSTTLGEKGTPDDGEKMKPGANQERVGTKADPNTG